MKKRLFAAGMLIVIGAVIAAYVWASGPVAVRPSSPQVAGVSTEEKSLTISATYFSAHITEGWNLENRATGNLTEDVYERWVLYGENKVHDDQLAITIARVPAGGMDEIADIHLRQSQPDVYRPIEVNGVLNGQGYMRLGDFEKAIFFEKDGVYASVVISGSENRKAQLESAIETVLQSWQWR